MSACGATRQLGILAAIIISMSQILPAQPYVYSSQTDHGTTIVKRFNLRTNINELFLRDSTGWNLYAEVDLTQRWLFLSDWDEPVYVVDIENPGNSRLLPFTENARGNKYIHFVPPLNRIYVSVGLADTEREVSYVYDATSLALLDSVPLDFPNVFSPDGSLIYRRSSDTTSDETFLESYSTATHTLVSRKNENLIGPPIYKPTFGSYAGYTLYGYQFPEGNSLNNKCQLYNLLSGTLYPEIKMPPERTKPELSGDGMYVIVEEVRLYPPDSVANEYRPGHVWIFESKTARPVSELNLPPEGQIHLFPNYPDTLYYYLPAESRSINLAIHSETVPTNLTFFTTEVLSDSSVRLEWRTQSETGNTGFEVQKSMNELTGYATIAGACLKGHGTTIEPQKYSYVDVGTSPGTWYYRLKAIDAAGNFHFSKPIKRRL